MKISKLKIFFFYSLNVNLNNSYGINNLNKKILTGGGIIVGVIGTGLLIGKFKNSSSNRLNDNNELEEKNLKLEKDKLKKQKEELEKIELESKKKREALGKKLREANTQLEKEKIKKELEENIKKELEEKEEQKKRIKETEENNNKILAEFYKKHKEEKENKFQANEEETELETIKNTQLYKNIEKIIKKYNDIHEVQFKEKLSTYAFVYIEENKCEIFSSSKFLKKFTYDNNHNTIKEEIKRYIEKYPEDQIIIDLEFLRKVDKELIRKQFNEYYFIEKINIKIEDKDKAIEFIIYNILKNIPTNDNKILYDFENQILDKKFYIILNKCLEELYNNKLLHVPL